MEVLLKAGGICFYGDWIGRPCDNIYYLKSIEKSNNQIRLVFDDMEVVADNPKTIHSDEHEFTVTHAERITISQRGSVTRIYEKTDNGIKKIDQYESTYIKIESPYYAICFSKTC